LWAAKFPAGIQGLNILQTAMITLVQNIARPPRIIVHSSMTALLWSMSNSRSPPHRQNGIPASECQASLRVGGLPLLD
jgi:hypothetical protein